MKKTFIILGIVVVFGVSSFIFYMRMGDDQVGLNPTLSPSLSSSPGPSVSSTSSPSEKPVGISTVVPECRLEGEVIFVGDGTFKTSKPNFYYSKVEDKHDTIHWSISPVADVSVGPNRFSSLPLPSGQEFITISFNGATPQYKTYELKASIDYPYVVNNKVEVLNKKCTGTIKVLIDY